MADSTELNQKHDSTQAPASAPDLFAQAHPRTILNDVVHCTAGLAWHDEQSKKRDAVETGVTEFIAAVPLFMGGARGYAWSAAISALNQAKVGDSTAHQMEDLALGAVKGGTSKIAMEYVGNKSWNFAEKGVAMGLLTRAADATLTRESYQDEKGNFSWGAGAKNICHNSFDLTAIGIDVAAFGVAHIGVGAADYMLAGKLSKTPLLTTALTGGAMGFTSGSIGEFRSELKTSKRDYGKIFLAGVEQGTLMGGAAAAGYGFTKAAGLPQVVRTDKAQTTAFQENKRAVKDFVGSLKMKPENMTVAGGKTASERSAAVETGDKAGAVRNSDTAVPVADAAHDTAGSDAAKATQTAFDQTATPSPGENAEKPVLDDWAKASVDVNHLSFGGPDQTVINIPTAERTSAHVVLDNGDEVRGSVFEDPEQPRSLWEVISNGKPLSYEETLAAGYHIDGSGASNSITTPRGTEITFDVGLSEKDGVPSPIVETTVHGIDGKTATVDKESMDRTDAQIHLDIYFSNLARQLTREFKDVKDASAARKAAPVESVASVTRNAAGQLMSSQSSDGNETRSYQYDNENNLSRAEYKNAGDEGVLERQRPGLWKITSHGYPEGFTFKGDVQLDQSTGHLIRSRNGNVVDLCADGWREHTLSEGQRLIWDPTNKLQWTYTKGRENFFTYDEKGALAEIQSHTNEKLGRAKVNYSRIDESKWAIRLTGDSYPLLVNNFKGSVELEQRDGTIKIQQEGQPEIQLHPDMTRTEKFGQGDRIERDQSGFLLESVANDGAQIRRTTHDDKGLKTLLVGTPDGNTFYEKGVDGWRASINEGPATAIDDWIALDRNDGSVWKIHENGETDVLYRDGSTTRFSGITGDASIDELTTNPLTIYPPEEAKDGPVDFAKTKSGIHFGHVTLPDGTQNKVIIREFNPDDARERGRVYMSRVESNVNRIVAKKTGIEQQSAPIGVRISQLLSGERSPILVQGLAGKDVGTQLKEWMAKDLGVNVVDIQALEIGAVQSYLQMHPDVRRFIANAAFDTIYRGNDDLVEFSQQTVPETRDGRTITPEGDHPLVFADPKSNYTTLPSTWGFAGFGITAEIAQKLAQKRLADIDGLLQMKADTFLELFSTPDGQAALQGGGHSPEDVMNARYALTPERIQFARNRLRELATVGFPKFLGVQSMPGVPLWSSKTWDNQKMAREYDVNSRSEAVKLVDIFGGTKLD
ncbi:MAG TPA: hypothetical protein V6C81_22475 [Planktothrix sp.]|jgi:hypothetical protein